MRTILRVSAAALLAVASVPAVLGAHTHAPTPSTWTLNVAASDFGTGPVSKSDVITITIDTEKWLKFTDVTVDADGKTWKTSWSGPQDGTFKPVTGMPGAQASFRTDDDSEHYIMPDGSKWDNYLTMSDDKKKVTIKATITSKDGKEAHQTLIYERTK